MFTEDRLSDSVLGESPVADAHDSPDARPRWVIFATRRRWKKDAGYHRQARVENAFFRYKSIFGGRLRAASPRGQAVEALVACNILNRMT